MLLALHMFAVWICCLQLQADNTVVRSWGEPQDKGQLLSHVDIVQKLGIVDQSAGVDVAGKTLLRTLATLTNAFHLANCHPFFSFSPCA